MDIDTWNAVQTWRALYGVAAKGLLFFAEDLFGVQWAIEGQRVVRFDPELGERQPFADSIELWAELILDDYEVQTGWPLAHEWQSKHGALAPGARLVPAIPFILGGKFDVANLRAMNAVTGRARIWQQTRDLPDGTTIRFTPTTD